MSTIASHAREQPTELPPDAIEDEEDEEDDEDDEEGIIAFAGLTNGLRHRRQLTKIDRYTKGYKSSFERIALASPQTPPQKHAFEPRNHYAICGPRKR